MTWTYYWAEGHHTEQPRYGQFDHKGCAVGCGAVAWAMLFCWGDYQAETGNAYWARRWGLYRSNGGRGTNDVAPLSQTAGVKNVIKEIRDQVDTFCFFGGGAVFPSKMDGASDYLSGRTGTSLVIHYNTQGKTGATLRQYALNSIRDRDTPVVIGTGLLRHYPVAYGYAWQTRIVRRCFLGNCWERVVYDRCFYVNQGWRGYGNEWIEASTWFAGEIYP
jgi:hypothetical protein